MSNRAHPAGLVAVAMLALLICAPVATAEIRSGSATDPESFSLEPYEDLVQASAAFDTVSGAIAVAAQTASAPPKRPDLALVGMLGIVNGSSCAVGGESATLASTYSSDGGEWLLNPAGIEGPAGKSISGATTTLSASIPGAVDKPFNCVVVATFDITTPASPALIDNVNFELTAPPPPPSPPPPPPPPPPPAAAVSIVKPKPMKAKPGSWRKLKVKVSNTGNAAARKVVLTVDGARGISLRPKPTKLSLGKIAAGKSKSAAFRVRIDRRAKQRSILSLKVRAAAGIKAGAKLVLEKKVKPKKRRKGSGGPRPGSGSLAQKIFYRYVMSDSTRSAPIEGYAFIDDTWAYNAIPDGGLPNCTEVTGTSKEPGCVRYSYDKRTGKLRIGALTGGKINGKGNLEIEGETYFQMFVPKAGTRYQVAQYTMGFSGLCGLNSGCYTWREDLTMTSAGEFVLSRSSTSTSGGLGGPPFIAIGNYPPDEHGTYAIEPKARITLRFADGKVERKTIAIFLNKRGKPDPANAGILLDDAYFTFAGDE